MTQYSKDRIDSIKIKNHPKYTLDEVNMVKLQNALDRHDLMNGLGFKQERLKIGKKQSIEVFPGLVMFYMHGLPLFSKTREEIVNFKINYVNGKFKNASP